MRKPEIRLRRGSNPRAAEGLEVRRKLTGQAAKYAMHHVKTYTITLIPEEGGYRAVCLAVAGCEAKAPSREMALEMVEDQIRARIVDAIARRQPVPVDRSSTKFLWMNLEEFLV
jgi:predicted RNase H-like HicB family nuclease